MNAAVCRRRLTGDVAVGTSRGRGAAETGQPPKPELLRSALEGADHTLARLKQGNDLMRDVLMSFDMRAPDNEGLR